MKNSFLLLLLITQISFGQENLKDRILSPDQMQEDFSMYRRMLEETHPGLYRYSSKEVIQNLMDSIEATLDKDKSYIDFYKDIASVNAEIKCAHSYLLPNADINRYLLTEFKTLPFFFYGLDNKVFVVFNGTLNEQIKPGFELRSINGRSIDEIKSIINKYGWADGDSESVKIRFLTGSLFWVTYYFFVDQSEEYEMVFKDLQDHDISVTVSAQDTRTTMYQYKKNSVNKEFLKMYNTKREKPFGLSFPDDLDKTAVLSLRSFGGKGMNDEESAQAVTRKFMDKAMKKIRKAGSESLIIDLRYNGGGWDVIGMEILSYLVEEESFQYYQRAFAATNDSEFFKYTGASESEIEEAKKELIPQEDGTFLLDPAMNVGLRPYAAKANRFDGDIYFLIHEMTGSAAVEFAALAKSMNLGIFIGTETNGAYQGGNGSMFIKMSLPNSGIFINSPLVSGYQELKTQKIKNRGIMPDYLVDLKREDLLNKYDRQAEFAKDLIRKRKATE